MFVHDMDVTEFISFYPEVIRGEIDRAVAEFFLDVSPQLRPDLHLNMRSDACEPIDEARHDDGFAIVADGDHEFPRRGLELERLLFPQAVLDQIERLTDRRRELLCACRRQHSLRGANEQLSSSVVR